MESSAEEKAEKPSACLSVFLRAFAFKSGVSRAENGPSVHTLSSGHGGLEFDNTPV